MQKANYRESVFAVATLNFNNLKMRLFPTGFCLKNDFCFMFYSVDLALILLLVCSKEVATIYSKIKISGTWFQN